MTNEAYKDVEKWVLSHNELFDEFAKKVNKGTFSFYIEVYDPGVLQTYGELNIDKEAMAYFNVVAFLKHWEAREHPEILNIVLYKDEYIAGYSQMRHMSEERREYIFANELDKVFIATFSTEAIMLDFNKAISSS